MTQGIFDWAWVVDNLGDIWAALAEHVVLTVIPVGLGFLMAFPMALASIHWPRLYSPLLGVAGILFAIPTLALFVVMIPFTGLSKATAIVPLTLYTLLILLRNTVEGLNGVPVHVREAAEAMGYTRARQLFRIELPLAVPVIMAGLGNLFMDGFLRQFPTPLIVGLVLSVTLAVAADLGLLGVQRVLTPWRRDPG